MMDISYNEPLTRDGIKGEFFLSVNGRVLVQGTHVRELAAHAFLWDNQVYYDVQVSENEFDIVSNPNVAEALATGPEGTYQLVVDRTANGVEWTAGGGNAHCLETYAARSSAFVTTADSPNSGVILNANSEDIPYKLQFRSLAEPDENGNEGLPHILVVKIDKTSDGKWQLRAEVDGVEEEGTSITTATGNLTTAILADFIEAAKGDVNVIAEEESISEDPDTYALMFRIMTRPSR